MASPTYSGEDEISGIACPPIGADQARDLVGIADGQAPMRFAAPLAGRVGRHKSGNALAMVEVIEIHFGSLQKAGARFVSQADVCFQKEARPMTRIITRPRTNLMTGMGRNRR